MGYACCLVQWQQVAAGHAGAIAPCTTIMWNLRDSSTASYRHVQLTATQLHCIVGLLPQRCRAQNYLHHDNGNVLCRYTQKRPCLQQPGVSTLSSPSAFEKVSCGAAGRAPLAVR